MKYKCDNDRITLIPDAQSAEKSIGDFLNEYCIHEKKQRKLYACDRLWIHGRPVKDPDEKMNDDLVILLEKSEPDWLIADQACQVLYENAFVYAVHKDPGIIIHNSENPLNCLNAQAARWQKDHGVHAPVRPLHRLDRDTGGIVLYSKIPFFQPWLDEQLAEKKIRRWYLAIVKAHLEKGMRFTVHAPIGRDRHVSGKYRISPTGKDALTRFEVLDRRGSYSLIRCTLETGRTHQIRVHLASKGLPLVNDPLYGVSSRNFRNMGLWAYEMEFHDPITHKKHKIQDLSDPDLEYFSKGERQ